jgi:uncharacterized protein
MKRTQVTVAAAAIAAIVMTSNVAAQDAPEAPVILAARAQAVVSYADRERLDIIKIWAIEGAPEGLFSLGRLQWYGAPELGIAEEKKQALGMIERAARMGHGAACTFLGDLQWAGAEVQQDPLSAIRWYEAGARSGDSISALRLARIYEGGVGVQRDPSAALRYYTAAANARGNPSMEAAGVLGYRYLTGTSGALQDLTRAQHYLSYSAQGGDATAQFNLGVSILDGILAGGGAREGVEYLVAASRQGHAMSRYVLSTLYAEGKFVNKDLALAGQLAEQAYADGVQAAMAVIKVAQAAQSKGRDVAVDASRGNQASAALKVGGTFKLVGSAAQLHPAPTLEQPAVDSVAEGDELQIQALANGWAQVRRKGGGPFRGGALEGWIQVGGAS